MPGQSLLSQLHNYINIPPELGQVEERWQLKRLVPMAVDRAVGEIMMPAVERSVTIACMTTQVRARLLLFSFLDWYILSRLRGFLDLRLHTQACAVERQCPWVRS